MSDAKREDVKIKIVMMSTQIPDLPSEPINFFNISIHDIPFPFDDVYDVSVI
jgi:hypothetical protein